MSYKTVEVELEQGRVRACGTEQLPEKARALLVILGPASPEPAEVSGPSVAELGASFVGIGNGTHTDLSTSKAFHSTCRLDKEDGFTVAVPGQPINEKAINELLADIP